MLIFLPVLHVSTRACAYVCTCVVPARPVSARVCRMVWACGAQAQRRLCRQHAGPGVRVAHSLCRASPPRTPSGPSGTPPAHTGAGGGSQSGPGRPGPLGNLYEPRADGPTEAALSCWPWSALETPLSGQPGGRGPRHTGVGLKASAAGRGSGCSAPGPCWHKCWAERGLAARQTAAPAADAPTFLGLRVP